MNPSPTALGLEASASPAAPKRRSPLQLAWAAARMYLVGFPLYGLLGIMGYFVLLATAFPLPAALRRRYSRRVIFRAFNIWIWVMEAIGIFTVDFQALDALRGLRGVVIAPNHPTLLDATMFLSRVPQLTCLMKRSILSNPFMGGVARFAGYLRNDHGVEFIRRGRDALLAGENLLIFPEGTRTVEAPVNAFKGGFALIATLAEAPVQTVFIDVPEFFLGKRWPIWRIPQLPVRFTVRTGRVFRSRPGQPARALSEDLEAYFREQLEAAGMGVRAKEEVGSGKSEVGTRRREQKGES